METTQHTPADVRERVVDEIVCTFRTLYPHARGLVAPAAYAAADRIIALLRTPRGEGEASDTLEKIDQARVMIARLNYGEREWKLSIPARDDDPDMVIHEALRSAALEIARLARELEATRAALRIAQTTAGHDAP